MKVCSQILFSMLLFTIASSAGLRYIKISFNKNDNKLEVYDANEEAKKEY